MSENMKSSEIAWIGDIPKSWSIKRVKYLATLKGRIGWQGLTSDEYTDEGPYLITGIDFENGKVNWDNCVHISRERWEEATEIQIQNGDLLITKDGTVGKVAIVSGLNDLASLNSGVLVIRTNSDFDRRFLFWVLQSEEFWVWFRLKNAGNSTIIHLYQNDFAEFCYTYPKTIEQTLIADFLEEQCKKIDIIATDIEKQIEILQKYKKSLIIETVTKGLDKSVSMKDSGIEWMGDVPKHYSLVPLKNLFWMYAGGDVDECDFSDEKTEKHKYAIYSNSLENNGLFGYMSKYRFKGDTITVTGRGDVGKALPRYDAYYPIVRLLVCVPQRKLNVSFFSYCINCADILGDQTAMAQLTTQKLGVIKVPVPDYEEQTRTANYLDCKCLKIDSIIESKKEQLTKITQHKKSLIYEYVTGKKRVKGAYNNGN